MLVNVMVLLFYFCYILKVSCIKFLVFFVVLIVYSCLHSTQDLGEIVFSQVVVLLTYVIAI